MSILFNTEGCNQKPTDEVRIEDLKNKNFSTFTYNKESDIPDICKDKITSKRTTNGKTEIRVTLPKSEADYYLNKDNPQAISEAYHKAKADGSNPELVKALEGLLGTPTTTTKPTVTKEQDVETKEQIENELISNVENPAKAKASKEDVHIIQYRSLQLENKEKALLSNKIRQGIVTGKQIGRAHV